MKHFVIILLAVWLVSIFHTTVYAASDVAVCNSIEIAYNPESNNIDATVHLATTIQAGNSQIPSSITSDTVVAQLWGQTRSSRYLTNTSTDLFVFKTSFTINEYLGVFEKDLFLNDIFPKIDFYQGDNSRKLSLSNAPNTDCTVYFNQNSFYIPQNTSYSGSCSKKPFFIRTNKFTCYDGTVLPNDSYCGVNSDNIQLVPDAARCAQHNGVYDDFRQFCAPCIRQNQQQTLNHNDVCSVSNDLCNAQIGLTCRPLTKDPTKTRCQYRADSRTTYSPNNTCIVGSDECRRTNNMGEPYLVCAETINDLTDPITTTQIKQCKFIDGFQIPCSSQNNSDGSNDFCTARLGQSASCYNNKCVPFHLTQPTPTHIIVVPSDYIGPSSAPIDPGNPFKVKTCPIQSGGYVDSRFEDTIEQGIMTAFGCMPTSITGISRFFFRLALGIGGGIAFLLIIWGGIRMILSTGDPKKLQESKEIITSAIVGLILIIFSIFVLRLIGYNILAIPGFG